MTWDESLGVVGMIAVAAPGAAFAAIGIPSLLGVRLSERTTSLCTRFATWTGLFCVVAVAVGLVLAGRAAVAFDAGQAVSFGGHEAEGEHFHFGVKFVFDRLSAPMLLLSYVLCGVIAAFARAYLHRETGFVRFFALLAMYCLVPLVLWLISIAIIMRYPITRERQARLRSALERRIARRTRLRRMMAD